VGDEITFVQPIGLDSFERVDFTFFCGAEDLTRKHWRDALRAGSTVLDLSGALDQETGVLVRAPWLGYEAAAVDLLPRPWSRRTPRPWPWASSSSACTRPRRCARLRHAAASVQRVGRAAMDELHQQTVSLLSFQNMPRATFDAQVAYNLLTGLGESAAVSLSAVEARVRRHYEALALGHWPRWPCR